MSGISTSTGLISGIDTAALVDQLVAIEARPRQLVEERVTILNAQKTAFLDVNARLSALDLSASTFLDSTSFGKKTATSSNTAVLSASADSSAAIGTYRFTVDRLVSTHQLISRGYTDSDTTALGTATTLSFDSVDARLDRETELSSLRGGAGVQRGSISITDRSGEQTEIDLSRAVTVDDVLRTINNSAAISITASVEGDAIVLTDTSGGSGNLVVSDVGDKTTATSLGLAGSVAGNTLTGSSVNFLATTTTLNAINDGLGVRTVTGQQDIQIDDGTSTFTLNLDSANTVQDVLDAINDDASNTTITASISDTGFVLTSTAAPVTVTALNGSNAGRDLGLTDGTAGGNTLTGSRVLGAINSRLLDNLSTAAAITAGTVDVNGTGIDLSSAESVSDVVSLINAQTGTTNVVAALNSAGNGLTLTHSTGASFDVSDTSGNLATQLGLVGTHADGGVDSGDLDLQYISENTRLDTLNGGKGVAAGAFVITDSNGVSATVDLTQGETTVAEVLAEINSRPIDVTARINDTGDGILIEDVAGGSGTLTVAESGSSTARDLGLLGEDEDADGILDGSYERTVDIEATDTLDDIADKINAASVDVSAAIINDGTDAAPFRLTLSSQRTGRDGSLVFDDGGLGLNATTLVEGRNAVVFFGSSDPAEALLLTSSTNALTDTVAGVTIDLLGESAGSVTLTVAQDTEQIVSAAAEFVDRFNAVIERINNLDSYNSDTEQRGLLLGDPTLANIRRQLISIATRQYEDVTGQYDRLTQVGIKIGSESKLTFDETKFRGAIATDLGAVTELFSLKTQEAAEAEEIAPGITQPGEGTTVTAAGFGSTLEDLLDRLTDSISGTLTFTTNNIDSQIELANDRIEQLNILLDNKRLRLERNFAAMELALSQLQSQQNALVGLANLAAGG